MLDGYVSTISELGNHSNLSATEQFRLKDAIDGYNSICGTSYEVTDALNGKIKDGEGNLVDSTQALKDNAAAWEQNAKAKAAANVATQYMEQELKTQQKLADAKAEFAQQEESYQKTKAELIKKGWSEESAANFAMNDDYKKAKQNVEDLTDTYNSAAEKQAYFSAMAAAASAGLSDDAQKAAGEIASSLSKLNTDSSNALTNAGINITDFSVKMQQAGVTSGQLNSISSENFAAMAASCGGNMDTLMSYIMNYNNTPVVDKNGKVEVDSSTLLYANGQVVVWNGSQLVYKSSGATVDYGTVVDATGAEYTYNQQGLTSKSATDTVDSSQTKDATNKKKDYNNTPLNGKNAKDNVNSTSVDKGDKKKKKYNDTPLKGKRATDTVYHKSLVNACNYLNTYKGINISDKSATITINHVDTYSKRNEKAAGGIRLHAAGGVMMRYHAHGAIANRPGAGVPLDIVGEAGAEAIVPLTNRKYSRPFARTIAEQMKQTGGGVSAQVVNNYTLNIDGSTIRGNDRAKELIEALVSELV